MDIEWAKDGMTQRLYILQARPETVHTTSKPKKFEIVRLENHSKEPLLRGQAVGTKVASGKVRIVKDPSQLAMVQPGDVLVAKTTNPDWEPVMKRASALIT